MSNNRSNAVLGTVGFFVVLAVLFGLYAGGVSAFSFSKADGGHVIVVRNGGLFDDNSIRQVINPNSGLTYSGWFSTDHEYPTSQRFFTVSAAQGSDSNEVINVPTKDGVSLGIEGTFYFTLNWQDGGVLRDFDNKFGTRQFENKSPWDGDDGWSAFLNASLGKLVQNDLRQQIGNVKCADLLPSCALVQNNSGQTSVTPTGNGNDTIQKVEQAINASFTTDVKNTLGGNYFTGINFVLSKVTPPDAIAKAITDAQAAFANNAKSTALQQQAEIDKQTNIIKQQGYNACTVCAQIDELKALPPGITTYAPGQGFAVTGK